MSDFVHLHVHSHYSTLDGAATIPRLIGRVKECGMDAVALTDHGNMFGAVEFYLKATDSGIKPIVGYESYVAPRDRFDRTGTMSAASRHLTLLATSDEGYRNLMKLASAAYLEGYYYRPRIDREILARHRGGLVAMSGCLSGEIASKLLREDFEGAESAAGFYGDLFGKGNFYLELQSNGLRDQVTANRLLVELGERMGLPTVATNDVHFLRREDARSHDHLLAIGTGKLLDDPNRMRFETDEFFFKSPEEMASDFRELPGALRATVEIAERCDLVIETGKYHHPNFQVPDGETLESHLRKLCEAGITHRYGDNPSDEIKKRLDHELDVIGRMGFPGYMLIVGDITRQAREMGIPVGPGRGSATGSVVCYALGITDLDPISYGLIFERFINEGRNEMPDIDLDFCQSRRSEIIDYVTNKYGRKNVAQIITFSRMAAKASIRDVGRVMNIPYGEVDAIAKLVPVKPGITLDEAMKTEPDFARAYETDETAREIIDIAMSIEGLVRQPGTHAAGVVVADKPLDEYCPLYRTSGSEDVVTQYPMKMIDAIGLLKIDFLGLQTLTVIDRAIKMIRERGEPDFIIEDIPLDDSKVYRMLAAGGSVAVFQFESSGMREMLRQARPDRLEDLIALNAMYRPGPIDRIPVFCARKNGREPIEYLHPKLEPFLKDTYGIICYQEQVIQVAHSLAGFTLSEADTLRKAMGKKSRELMDKYRPQFIDGVVKQGFTESQGTQLWDEIVTFSGYGFNKSHSAAYALVAYRTAYLKANYPSEFTAALLTCEMGNSDKLDDYIRESKTMGIEILPPDVNLSGVDFLIEPEGIRFSLAAVKGVGSKSVEGIVEARDEGGPFKDLFDFCERCEMRLVNKTVVESLVKSGAFDRLGDTRAQQFHAIPEAMAVAQAAQKDKARGQASIFDIMGGGSSPADDARQMDDLPEWPEHILLEKEREALGFYISSHPLDAHSGLVRQYSTTSTAKLGKLAAGAEVMMGGLIVNVQKKRTRARQQQMAVLLFEDLDGTVEAVVFPRTYEREHSRIAPDRVAFIHGKVDQTGDEASIIVDEIIPIDEARERLTGEVLVRMRSADATGPLMEDIGAIFRENPGQARVRFELATDEGETVTVRASQRVRVAASAALFDEIEALLGEGSVLCARNGSGPTPRERSASEVEEPLAF